MPNYDFVCEKCKNVHLCSSVKFSLCALWLFGFFSNLNVFEADAEFVIGVQLQGEVAGCADVMVFVVIVIQYACGIVVGDQPSVDECLYVHVIADDLHCVPCIGIIVGIVQPGLMCGRRRFVGLHLPILQ